MSDEIHILTDTAKHFEQRECWILQTWIPAKFLSQNVLARFSDVCIVIELCNSFSFSFSFIFCLGVGSEGPLSLFYTLFSILMLANLSQAVLSVSFVQALVI